jgi:hypothetical protein
MQNPGAGSAGAALGIEVEMSAAGANWNGKPDPREAGGTPYVLLQTENPGVWWFPGIRE